MDSTFQATAKTWWISFADTRRGPCVAGYFAVFFVRFPDMGFVVFFRATDLPAGALVKCSLTRAAS
jgi:hypothetical protein